MKGRMRAHARYSYYEGRSKFMCSSVVCSARRWWNSLEAEAHRTVVVTGLVIDCVLDMQVRAAAKVRRIQ